MHFTNQKIQTKGDVHKNICIPAKVTQLQSIFSDKLFSYIVLAIFMTALQVM